MTAIFKREFRSYFTSPLGYIYLAVFYFFEGMYFSALYGAATPHVEYIFPSFLFVLAVVLVTPVITMRLLSEDRRQKVDQALLTAPVGVGSIVLGKFFSAFAIYGLALAPTVLFEIVISVKADINWLVYLNALLGALLIGAALIAMGMFISSLTESPVISCVLTMVIFVLLLALPSMGSITGLDWVIAVCEKVAFINLFEAFAGSIFHIIDVIYLLSIAGVFVFASVRMVERRRWA